jgi:hypothetical protein
MDDLRDFIDPDEGRPTPAPFFAEALPCESCGRPVYGEREPAYWDRLLLVGPCCRIEEGELPDTPVCSTLFAALMRCDSVAAVCDVFETHVPHCPLCQGRRQATLEEVSGRIERAA